MNKKKLKKGAYFKPPFFISYLITNPNEYGDTIELFEKNLTKNLSSKKIDIVCFRDKKTKNIKQLAILFLNISKKFNISKILINSDLNLALELGFNGIHLTSHQFALIKTAIKNNLYTIISCHNEYEVKLAKLLGANAVTYSPIFYKQNKGEPKGLNELQNIVKKYQDKHFNIIALGGIINNNHIKQIKTTNAIGFASIRYFI